MDLRPITAADIPAIAQFAVVGMRPHLFPHLRLDMTKVHAMVGHFAQDQNREHFHLAAFEEDRPVAVLAALVQPILWFERHEAHVVMCRSVRAGAGAKLIKAMMEWAKADLRVRQVSFAQEPDADGRQMHMLLRRYGFQRSQQVALWAKE